jgi:hypothetical protein
MDLILLFFCSPKVVVSENISLTSHNRGESKVTRVQKRKLVKKKRERKKHTSSILVKKESESMHGAEVCCATL